MSEFWGYIGHDTLGRAQNRRDLGLGASTRFANELSVPGLAGLSFLKSLVWALIGLEFAALRSETGRPIPASTIAEGVEALAAWHVVRAGPKHPGRIRGARKLPLIGEKELTLRRLARGRGYVSQPIRVGMGGALPGLGLAEARNSRFNSFEITPKGREFLTRALGGKPAKTALPRLWDWLDAGVWNGRPKEISLISPDQPLNPGALAFFREMMEAGEGNTRGNTGQAKRRAIWLACQAALAQDQSLEGEALVQRVLAGLDTETRAGLAWAEDLFRLREAAFSLLAKLEDPLSVRPIPEASPNELLLLNPIQQALARLKDCAATTSAASVPEGQPADLAPFLRVLTEGDDPVILLDLVARDGVVLRLSGSDAAPLISLHPDHISARVGNGEANEDDPTEDGSRLFRLHNLCALCRETRGLS